MLRSNLGVALAFMLSKFAEMDHPRSALTLESVVTPSKAFRAEARRKLPFSLNRYRNRSCYIPHQGERECFRRVDQALVAKTYRERKPASRRERVNVRRWVLELD